MDPSVTQRFSSFMVFVVGDIMLDVFVAGTVDRISPEAPVPVLTVSGQGYAPGGAANVAANLAAMGAEVALFGIVGDDDEGERVLGLLGRMGIDTEGVLKSKGISTTTKTRLMASNQQIARVDRERPHRLSDAERERLMRLVAEKMDRMEPQAVILSDYDKGVLDPALCRTVIEAARRHAMFVAVDPKGRDFTKYRGADLITPNVAEMEEATGVAITDEASMHRAFTALQSTRAASTVVLTRGPEGMSYSSGGGPVHTRPSRAREVYDVTGAGDTAVSALVLGYLATGSWDQAVAVANAAAAVAVSRAGTHAVTARELAAELGGVAGPAELKRVTAVDLPAIGERARALGKTVVFTNGCFDLFHVGHLTLLNRAKSMGDLLVVAVNSDCSVRRLKGEGSPLIGEDDRARLLASLECVDYVVIFDEDTPLRLIEVLRPHVIVKGGDYTAEQVVGREVVESYGGRVEIVPLLEGISTSALIERIRRGGGRARRN